MTEHDPINHPAHYTSSEARCHECGAQIECIDVIEVMPLNMGVAVKYLWRAGLKDDAIQDLGKAVWHIEREIERLEARRE